MGIKGKMTVIEHTDPRYLEVYRQHWGSGQSITSSQATRLACSAKAADPDQPESPKPRPEPDPS